MQGQILQAFIQQHWTISRRWLNQENGFSSLVKPLVKVFPQCWVYICSEDLALLSANNSGNTFARRTVAIQQDGFLMNYLFQQLQSTVVG